MPVGTGAGLGRSGPVGAGTGSSRCRPVSVPLTDRKKRCKTRFSIFFQSFCKKEFFHKKEFFQSFFLEKLKNGYGRLGTVEHGWRRLEMGDS